jgi:hypothetical protein
VEITKQEYDSIIRRMDNGELSVLIDTAGFRKLFSKVDGRSLSEKVGVPVSGHVVIIRALPAVEFVCLLGSSVFLALAIRWFAFLGVPLLWTFCAFFKSRASYGRQRIVPAAVVLVGSLAFAIAAGQYGVWLRVFVASLGVLQFVTRFLYWFTARLAFGIIERSHIFFSMFYLEPRGAIVPLIWTNPPQHEKESETIGATNSGERPRR